MKKWIIIAVFGLLGVLVFNKIANTSVVDIKVTGAPAGSKISYKLSNQSTAKVINVEATSNTLSRQVPNANYLVTITSGYSSYITAIKTSGFLAKVTVNAAIKTENARTFVGDNPGLCMHLLGGKLVSYACTGDFSELKLHLPATPSLPGYTTAPAVAHTGQIEGLVDTPEGTFALIQPPAVDFAPTSAVGSSPQLLLHLTGNLSVDQQVPLKGLAANTAYSIAPYLSGFIVYDRSYKTINYFTSAASTPLVITLPAPDSSFTPTSLTVSGQTITAAYTNDREDTDPSKKGDPTAVVVYTAGHSNAYHFSSQATTVNQCAQDKLCILNNRTMDIYRTGQAKPELLFSINDVDAIESSGSPHSILAVRPTGVTNINIDDGSGYESYSFGAYKFCGIQPAGNGYLLCIASGGANSALYVDQTLALSDAIDKQILKLLPSADISKVSVSGKIIYIVPLGKLEYIPSLHSYGVDPALAQSTRARISHAVDAAGINQGAYSVIITAPISF